MGKENVLLKKFIVHIFLASAFIFSFFLVFVNAETENPSPTALKYINDYTSTLDTAAKEYIVSVGKELEYKTGAQQVVVIIDSLKGKDIESYANELFRTWGIGQKGKDNGLLILIAMQDRRWRVEVGTSLEGAVTDIYSARVMDTAAAPRFKEGNYSQGIRDAYSIFADTIAKEYNVTLDRNEKVNLYDEGNVNVNSNSGALLGIPILLLIILDLIFNRGRITGFLVRMAFLFGRGNGHGGRNGRNNGGGGYGGMGGGSSSGGGSSGSW
jgi:uncharacterized protein